MVGRSLTRRETFSGAFSSSEVRVKETSTRHFRREVAVAFAEISSISNFSTPPSSRGYLLPHLLCGPTATLRAYRQHSPPFQNTVRRGMAPRPRRPSARRLCRRGVQQKGFANFQWAHCRLQSSLSGIAQNHWGGSGFSIWAICILPCYLDTTGARAVSVFSRYLGNSRHFQSCASFLSEKRARKKSTTRP